MEKRYQGSLRGITMDEDEDRGPSETVSGAEARGGVIELIKEFWMEEWNRTEDEVTEIRATAETELVEPLRRHLEGKDLPVWTEEAMRQGMHRAHKKTRGAGGVE